MNHFAQRAFHIGEAQFAKNADLSKLPADQLRTFQDVGLAGPKVAVPDPATTASADTGKATAKA